MTDTTSDVEVEAPSTEKSLRAPGPPAVGHSSSWP